MRFGRIYAVCYGVVIMKTIEDMLDKMYEDWMHAKWCGHQSKDDTIRLIELSYNWDEFCEEVKQVLDNADW